MADSHRCPICGSPLSANPRARTCSSRCRKRLFAQRQLATGLGVTVDELRNLTLEQHLALAAEPMTLTVPVRPAEKADRW